MRVLWLHLVTRVKKDAGSLREVPGTDPEWPQADSRAAISKLLVEMPFCSEPGEPEKMIREGT